MASPANNKIFDSTLAADGDWRNVSNFTALSIQLSGVEGNIWIEASNDPSIVGVPPSGNAGVNVSGSLPSGSPIPLASGELAVLVSGTNVLWSPSCLAWNWIRVRKDSTAETLDTKAFLFGQNG
jgi:hypothetical protein